MDQRRVWGYFKGEPKQWVHIHRDPESGQILVNGFKPFRLTMPEGELLITVKIRQAMRNTVEGSREIIQLGADHAAVILLDDDGADQIGAARLVRC